ncbi:MAG: hybrid cluster-associated redox disulfide protein [Halocynthiibacter sp.]|jgi:hybrid cluster-associated redox disulfide protein
MKDAPPISTDLTLNDLMVKWPATMPVFMRHKMLCVGCLVSPFHTIDDACLEYDLDMDQFIEELQRAISLP